MEILPLTDAFASQMATLLAEAFPCYRDSGLEEAHLCLSPDRVALGAVENGKLLGFVGAIAQYGVTAWELHPLVVEKSYRGKGLGRNLCLALEDALAQRGCLTIYLGSDDEDSSTSLADCNLFENTFEKIARIQNIKNHPFGFYQRVGYQIIGVIPDANGPGKPDLWLAKSLMHR